MSQPVRLRRGAAGALLCLLLIAAIAPGAVRATDAKLRLADEVAGKWLALIDGRQYRTAWEQAASLFRAQIGIADWEAAVIAARRPLGNMLRRQLVSATFATTLPGAPQGEYVVLLFQTDFEHLQGATETVTPMLDGDRWRVSGYYVRRGG